jgi:hypothetical protein
MIQESIEAYHANQAVSHSKLETFRRRPALYYKKYIQKSLPEIEPSVAFRIGSAVHCAVLEPTTFTSRYAVKPEGIDRRTKIGKEDYAAFEAGANGKTIISGEDLSLVQSMTEAVRDNPIAAQLLENGTPEISWRTDGKISLQCRTDWFSQTGCELTNGRGYIVDLKTIDSLDDSYRGFERAVFSYGYHRQAGFYLPLVTEKLGIPIHDSYFIAVEKCEPFGVAVYRLSDEAVACGQDETIKDLQRLKSCIESGVWPNIDPVVRSVELPKWYTKEEQ